MYKAGMPRPATSAIAPPPEADDAGTSTPDRLLRAGLARARAEGFRRLTVRAVAQDAGVNLGSFVYHFGSRDQFIAQVIAHWYTPLLARVQQSLVTAPGSAMPSLKSLMLGFIDDLLAERQFVGHLVADAAAGEVAARQFLQACGHQHPAIFLQAIEAAQVAGQVRPGDPRHILLMLVATISLPVLLFESLSGRDILPTTLVDAFEAFSLERAHVEERLDWVLQSLSPVPGV